MGPLIVNSDTRGQHINTDGTSYS